MQKVVRKTVTQKSNSGASVVSHESATDTMTQTVASIVYFISGVIEITLAFRFVLRMAGANPNNAFVSGIYGFTRPLLAPFRGIFSPVTTTGLETTAVFEPVTLVALFVYAVIAWGIVRLIAIMAGQSDEEL